MPAKWLQHMDGNFIDTWILDRAGDYDTAKRMMKGHRFKFGEAFADYNELNNNNPFEPQRDTTPRVVRNHGECARAASTVSNSPGELLTCLCVHPLYNEDALTASIVACARLHGASP